MGRTTPTTTELLRREIEEWKPFRNELSKKDRKEFDSMLKGAHVLNYAMMMAMPKHPVPIPPIMMSIIFRHYLQLAELKPQLE